MKPRPNASNSAATPSDSDAGHELKLVRDKPLDEVGPYKFERRREHRWTTSGQVTFVDYGRPDDAQPHAAHPGMPGTQKRIGSLQLRDVSSAGVGVWSQRALPIGSQVAVFFPPHGHQAGYDRMGKVVRCNPDDQLGQGYDVGLELHETLTHAA